jgi:hypothetical protein
MEISFAMIMYEIIAKDIEKTKFIQSLFISMLDTVFLITPGL